MESGTFGRGRETVASDCSLLFTGNIDVDGDAPSPRYRHLAEPLPFELRDSAFLDRIHGYLPGWGLPKLNPEVLAGGIGFVSDFFGEALLKLRGFPFATTYARLAGRAPHPGMTQGDVAAVEKISRALTKLVFPLGAGPWDDDWVADVFRLAAELRQIVHDQLCRLAPGEFRPHAIGWSGGERAEPRAASPLRLPRLRPGEAYLLDRQPLPEGAECRLRRIEVLANDGGDGLSFGPGFDRDAVRAVERAYRYLRAEARALGLAHPRFREAGWTVAVEGREPVAAGVGLPVVLAFLTLASGAVPPEPLVAVGDVSLHGDLVAPEDLAERLQHLPELAAGGILVLPEPVPEGPRSGWTLISAPTLAHLLAALRR